MRGGTIPDRATEDLMQSGVMSQRNVERIATRIVANELEFRGFRVTDLNKEGLAPNVDLLAAREGRLLQIQVKGASQEKRQNGWEDWWVGYGYSSGDTIARKKPMFNRVESFYEANVVVLVAVRTPSEYRCVVLPMAEAEKAAQINLDRDYRTLTLAGETRSSGKTSIYLDRIPDVRDPARKPLFDDELKILRTYIDNWNI
jgi:hypothetical protein